MFLQIYLKKAIFLFEKTILFLKIAVIKNWSLPKKVKNIDNIHETINIIKNEINIMNTYNYDKDEIKKLFKKN